MASSNQIELVVTVEVDKANKSIKTVNANLSSMEAAATKSAQGASRGIDGMTASMAKAVVAGNAVYDILKRALGALRDFTLGATRTQDEIGKTAQKLGLTVKEFSELRHIAEMSGADVGQLSTAVGILSRNMLQAAQGSEEQRRAFSALGVQIKNQDGSLRSVNAILEDLADRFQTMPDGATKTALAMVVLGRSGKDLVPFLNQGGQAIRNARVEADALRRVISEKTFRAAEHFQDNLTRLRGALEGLAFKIAEELLPQLIRFTDRMVNFAKDADLSGLARQIREAVEWVKNLGVVIVAYSVAARLAAVAKAMYGVAAAARAMNIAMLANPWGLAAAGVTAFGLIVWNEKKKLDQMNESLAETAKRTAILGHIKAGKTLKQITAAGFTEDDIRQALTGRKDIGDEGLEIDVPKIRIGGEPDLDALELAAQIRKQQAKVERESLAAAQQAGVKGQLGFARDFAEINEQVRKWTTFTDDKGVERRIALTRDAWANVIDQLESRWGAFKRNLSEDNRKAITDHLKNEEEAARKVMDWEAQRYQQRLQNDMEIAERNMDHLRQAYAFEEHRAGFERDARLRQLETADAQTVGQKIAVEQQKAAIEIEYLEKIHEVRQRLYDLDTSRMLLEDELTLKRLGYKADEIKARIGELSEQREIIRQQNDEASDAAIQAARENASSRAAAMIRDHNQQVFDSLKQQAGGVFDALLTRSQSVWSSIANSFKTAMLTAIKEVVTSRVAAMLMGFFGQRPGGGAAPAAGGGWATALGGFGAIFMGGAGGASGWPGGAPGGTPPFLPSGGAGAPPGAGVGNWGGMAGMAGFLPGLKEFLGIGGSVQTGAGTATTWGAASASQKLSSIGKSNAALLGGAILAMDGLRRGGFAGLAETTAGGALIGFKFGGPLGAAIGAGAGAVAGMIRLFVKGAQEKARDKIKATYGVDISDKGVLRQIVEIAKSGFGGNLDVAIRTQQVRDLVQLYAMSTGQPARGMPEQVHPLNLVQRGGSLHQSAGYANGAALPGLGGLPTMDAVSAGVASGGGLGTTVVNLQIDSQAVGNIVIRNGRVVAQGAINAMKSNAGRRELTSLQMSPGLLTA